MISVTAISAVTGKSKSKRRISTSKSKQKKHTFLYWEFHEGGSKQAVRYGNWKALRLKRGDPLELYDVSKDIGEEKNVASQHADVVKKIEDYLKTSRTESETWPLKAGKK
jgi:arylsulfatase A-like enzyme